MKSSSSVLLGGALLASGAASLSAQIYAYEPFDYDLSTYTATTLLGEAIVNSQVLLWTSQFGGAGLNGGTGWNGKWVAHKTKFGDYGSLVAGMGYTDGVGNSLLTSGMSLRIGGTETLDANWWRPLADPSAVTASTYYLSFLMERQGLSDEEVYGSDPDGNLFSRVAQSSIVSSGPIPDFGKELFSIGGAMVNTANTDTWGLQSDNYVAQDFPVQFSYNQQFVVIKVVPGGGTDGTDYVSVYLNPLLSSEGANTPAWEGDIWTDTTIYDTSTEPPTPIGKEVVPFNMATGGYEINAGKANPELSIALAEANVDEIRFAGSWADAAPVDGIVVIPEPRAFALFFGLMASLGVLARRRR